MASRILVDAAGQKSPCEVTPAKVYYGSKDIKGPIKLRIATGGAGQSGLIKALANAFIDYCTKPVGKCEPFGVAWIKSDTTASFNHIADNTADLSITYHEKAEEIAIKQGIADKNAYVYAWRDHFVLVGPKHDPAKLAHHKTIQDMFSQLFIAAVKPDSTIRFLSRFDKSATNIKESVIWASIGQTPWSYPFSFFYHISTQFPYQALATAAALEEYTLTDRGTWHGVDSWIREKLKIIREGKDEDKTPIMLNPAHILVGMSGDNKAMAEAFAKWVKRLDGGQKVVSKFEKDGVPLYTPAPLEKVSSKL